MSEAEELLNSLSNDATAYTSRPSEEPHIVIGDDRIISVPESLQRIAVQFDHNVETVTFDCPRYWDDNDLSELYIYINYLRKDGVRGRYLAKNVVVDSTDSNMIHFDWTITNEITVIEGKLVFSVCAVITNDEGFEERHWNSELNTQMTVSGGLECTEVIPNEYPDIVTDLLARMDSVVAANTPILDKSLMQAGLAADAKSAGDAIRAIDDRVTQISEGSEFTEVIGNPIQIDVVSKNKCIVTPIGPGIEQNGTPSLNNPVPVLGMGSMEEINVLDYSSIGTKTVGGVTIEYIEDGYLVANGTQNANYPLFFSETITDLLEDGETYSMWAEQYGEGLSANSFYLQVQAEKADGTRANYYLMKERRTFTVDKTTYTKYQVMIQMNMNALTLTNEKNRFMLYKGTDDKTYTPPGYARAEICHYSDDQEENKTYNLDLPIGMVLFDNDTIYEENGDWYHGKNKYDIHVFTGDEIRGVSTEYTNTIRYLTYVYSKYIDKDTKPYCNYLKGDNTLAGQDVENIAIHSGEYLQVTLSKNKWGSTMEEIKAKLKALYDNGTPMYSTIILAEPTRVKITDSTLISQLNELSTMTTHKGINNFVLTSAGKDGLMKLEYKLYNLIGYEDIEEFDIDISELKRQMGDVSSVLNKINGEEV